MMGLSGFKFARLQGAATQTVPEVLSSGGRAGVDVVDADGGDETLADVAVFVDGVMGVQGL